MKSGAIRSTRCRRRHAGGASPTRATPRRAAIRALSATTRRNSASARYWTKLSAVPSAVAPFIGPSLTAGIYLAPNPAKNPWLATAAALGLLSTIGSVATGHRASAARERVENTRRQLVRVFTSFARERFPSLHTTNTRTANSVTTASPSGAHVPLSARSAWARAMADACVAVATNPEAQVEDVAFAAGPRLSDDDVGFVYALCRNT